MSNVDMGSPSEALKRSGWRLSLPVVITTIIVFLVGSTGILTTLVTLRGSRSVIQFLVSDIMDDSRNRILEDTLAYVFEGSDSLGFLAGLVSSNEAISGPGALQLGAIPGAPGAGQAGMPSPGASGPAALPPGAQMQLLGSDGAPLGFDALPPAVDVLAGFFGEFLEDNPQFLSAAFTAANGAHVRAIRMEDGTLSVLAQAVQQGVVISAFDHENPAYASRFPVFQTLPADRAYLPQRSEWFQEAVLTGELIWTDARALDVIPTAGLTSAVPIRQGSEISGVISLDISLSEISRFLGTAPALDAQSFIADPSDGSIIAFPEGIPGAPTDQGPMGDRFLVQENGTARLITVGDLDETLIAAGLSELASRSDQLVQQGSAEFPFSFGGSNYLSSFSAFPEDTGWNWVIGIAVPQEVFLDRILDSVLAAVLIAAIVVLVGMVMGILVARRISQPLRRLSDDMQQIKAFELDKSAPIESRVREVSDMSNSLESMKAGLRSFKKYVPAGLVRQLIDMGTEAELGGDQKTLTVLFSDIAGFSGIAEILSPEELVARLAEYLGALSDVIERGRGTVDKYIGDAIMAFWGAPIDLENPELRAVETALECQAEARRINEKWRAEGLDISFHVRIGINTGELIVGNMGSESRLNYTVIGDAVNLASRLEGANKQYHTDIMISHSTYEAVADSVACRIVDRVQVKGRVEPIMVYEPLGRKTAMGARALRLVELHNEAWHLYAETRFRDAAVRFKKIYEEDRSNSLAALYFKRCAALIKSPPGPDWVAQNRLESK